MITPAISVLSAVEGLRVVNPELEPLVIPLTVVIILVLFTAQRLGTAKVARLFGPIMTLWFVSIGVAGAAGIAVRSWRSCGPCHRRTRSVSWSTHPASGFFAMAAVVLAITGAEALYADLGHFGRRPITIAWLALVYPGLHIVLPRARCFHLGRSELLSAAPFFLLAPSWAQLPMVLLATAATVIASQAVITGAFSVARQAVQLGYLPRLRILHTSRQTIGQIYVPYINWALMIAVIALGAGFPDLSGAGVCVRHGGDRHDHHQCSCSTWRAASGTGRGGVIVVVAGPILLLEALFLAANLTKLVQERGCRC